MNDSVNSPNHYQQFSKEVKDIIRFTLGDEGYKAYCQGNEIKYRLRAGFKDSHLMGAGDIDLAKAMKYNRMRLEVSDATPPNKD